ncbi:MAG TPA: fibronectin type III domain-containing protein, partial [Nitrospiria bacterium]|nr:fibronectin type III domain-containing protein [Nitrospiria bacterium]
NSASDNCPGTLYYRVYRNGILIQSTASGYNFTTFSDTGADLPGGHLQSAITYTYTVAALDSQNNLSPQSSPLPVTTPDNIPPTPPSFLIATPISTSQVRITWGPATDNVGVTGYDVYRDGVLLTASPLPPSATTYTDSGLTSCVKYDYIVVARDAAGNTSPGPGDPSAPIRSATVDVSPPSTPTNLQVTGTVGPNRIDLSWTGSTDNCTALLKYRIYRNGVLIGETTSGGTSYTDSGVYPSTTYNYAVSAVDDANNESPRSGLITQTTSVAGQASKVHFYTTSQSVVAGSSSQLVIIHVEDIGGNLLNYTGTVDITSNSSTLFFDTSDTGSFGSAELPTLPILAGVATFYFKDTVAHQPVITAAVSSLTQDTQQETITGGAINHFMVSASPTSLNAGAATTITITAHDVYHNVVSTYNNPNNLNLTQNGAGTAIQIVWTGTGVTDNGTTGTLAASSFSNGVASLTLADQLAEGPITITVSDSVAGTTGSTADTADPPTTDVTWNAGPGSPSFSTVASNPGSVAADGTTTSTITVTLKDQYGNAVSGKSVSLSSSRGATDTIVPPNPTDANGQTTGTVASATIGTSTITATDTTDGIIIFQTATVQFQ